MAVTPAEQMRRESRNVTPIRLGERMYYVEAEMLVPHKFLVAVPAADLSAACRLAADIVRNGRAYGIPDFAEAEKLAVSSIKSGCARGSESADRIEPVPAEFKRNMNRNA